jgi:hypothetical protein
VLTDGWKLAGGGAPGFTCCSGLSDASFEAGSRIDLVWHRGPVRAESAAVFGTSRRTPGGLFGSDHAGVVMTLSLAKAMP